MPTIPRRWLPALLLAACACGWASAQAPVSNAPAGAGRAPAAAPEFRSLGQSRTFQSEVVTEVLRDRVGFLWVGTREGLFLHDGQRFRKFEHAVQDDTSLSSNGVRSLFEDDRGRLWVATITGGLNLLDRASWRFRHWRTDAPAGRGPSHDGVFALAQGDGGRLWVGTQAGLDLFDPATDRFRKVALGKGGEFVMALLRDRRGRLWVGTFGGGLFRSDDGSRFVRVDRSADGAPVPTDVFTLEQDVRGQVWVGTRGGLYRVGADGATLHAAAFEPVATTQTLVNVTEIEPTADGGLWLGTFGVGLYRVDAAQRRIEYVPLGVEGPGGQHVDQGALALDAHGGLFVGTFGAGLLKARDAALSIRRWREEGESGSGLASEDVYAVQPDGQGRLYAGSFGGGVDVITLADGGVQPLSLPVEPSLAGQINGVLDLLRDPDGTLWAASSRGVYRYRPDDRAFRHYVHPDAATAYTYALLRDRAGRLWAGTGGGGLLLHRPAQDDFVQFKPRADDPTSLSSDFVTAMLADRRGRLWVGTRSGGVNVCTLRVEQLRCERIGAGGRLGLSHYHVTSLRETAQGDVLVGTAGGGLNRLRLDAAGRVAAVDRWSRGDGLMDDNVMAMAYAPDGALWLATRGGFTRLDAGLRTIENYGPVDGLPTTVFNPKAVASIDGRLYWGTQQGVLAIDPAVRPPRRVAPATVIASVNGLPPALQPRVPAWEMRSLELPSGQPFSLEFAVLGFDGGDPEYQYRLADSEPWTGLDERGQLTLHALAPGDYALQVRGRRAGSAWTGAAPVALSIVPPWWQRTAVQLGAVALVLAAVVAGFALRVRRLRRRNRELRAIQAQREQALAAARDSGARLEEAYATLRGLTMRLEAAKEEERKHLVRELHDEFGQALTAAKINLRLALVAPGEPGATERLVETVAMVDRLIAQVRTLSFDLRPPLLDEMGLVPALQGYLDGVAHRSGVPIDVSLPAALPPLGTDREIMVFRIVQEAVTNALRHAGADRLSVALAVEDGGLRVGVRDDGRGFDPQAPVEAGHGFGLFGMRERVRELGGRFDLDAAPGAGTRVGAFIPLDPEVDHARRAG
ncbi:sensor histidine kinase [Cognatilysobacter tabacisoli]|uniref:sensor histidine kinase n=1 Tax=Cognatilysobacter tabacisoli TaxID=2315424 RepID=UPI000E6B38A0|nr:two-component regulator propeller domain-containing protein [Lysobacter tabacisoli]